MHVNVHNVGSSLLAGHESCLNVHMGHTKKFVKQKLSDTMTKTAMSMSASCLTDVLSSSSRDSLMALLHLLSHNATHKLVSDRKQ